MLLLAQLKLPQRLGYMPVISDVPPAIIDHVCTVRGVRPLPRVPPRATTDLAANPGTRKSCGS